MRNIQEYYNILSSPNADQNLPKVVFIERASATGGDEHPDNNIQTGAASVQTIITALLNSSAWSDSAFILTYDEGGGLFDHVGPILEHHRATSMSRPTWARLTRLACSTSLASACRSSFCLRG